jgi:hypothetical protein
MAYAVRRLTQEKVDKAIKAIDASRKAGQHIKSQLVADGGGLYLKLPQASYTSWLRFGGRRISPGAAGARRN